MSEGTATVVGDAPCVLVVGDSEPADEAMDALEAQFEGAALLRERTLEGALERLAEQEVHCLVCPFVAPDDGSTPADTLLDRLVARTDGRQIVAVTDGDDAARAIAAGASDVVDRTAAETVLTARVRTVAERERYRLAASESERRHRAILEHAAAVVWVLDAGGDVEYASPAVESRMGYTPTELERTAITRLVHPDDRETARDTLASVAAAPVGTTERVTLRLGHADGTWQVSELTVTNRLEDPNVEGIVVTRTGTGPAVESARSDDVRAGIDRLADAFFAIGPRDELQYANRAAIRLFSDAVDGSRDDVPIGTVVWDLLPDELAGTIADRVREAQATESVVEFETTPSSLENGVVVSVHPGDDGVSIHATERSRGAASSTVSTDRDRLDLLESVVDALEDGIAVLEGTTVRLANPALLELTETDGLVGRDLEELFDDELAATVRERTRSPVVRWMDPVTGELAGETTRPVDVFVAPLPAPDRTLCVVRDRRGGPRAALSTVSRTVADLRRAETPSAVRNTVTEAVRECTGADVAVWYLAADDRFRPAAVAAATDGAGAADRPVVEPPPIERDAPLAECLDAGEPTVFERGDLDGALARIGLRAERVLAVPIAERGVVLATSTEPMAFEGSESEPIGTLSDAAAIALEGLERADSLRSCRHDRSRLQVIADRADQLCETDRALLAADTRDDVERRLCEALVSLPSLEPADGIELAWAGRVDDGRETVVPSTWAGRDGDFLEATTIPLGEDVETPTGTAAATHEPALREGITETETGADDGEIRSDAGGETRSWRRSLLERGFRSALSLPLASGEFRYGTITVYAAQPSAFDDRTRRACEHLATVAGEAIGAIETKRALLADRITELEVVLRDESEPLSAIAHRLEQRIDVRAVIPRSSGGSTVFCSVSAGDADAIREGIDSLSAVELVAVVSRGDADTVLEIGLSDPTIAGTIADYGGVLRSLTPVDDRVRLTIELGQPIGVRSFVRALERTHPGTELAARRERDRQPRSVRPFDELSEHLSERQRRTLEAAYYGGFFEWPREQTGEEVAESLGVSQPTFSRHLRTAQRKLFALLFDESDAD